MHAAGPVSAPQSNAAGLEVDNMYVCTYIYIHTGLKTPDPAWDHMLRLFPLESEGPLRPSDALRAGSLLRHSLSFINKKEETPGALFICLSRFPSV